MIFRETIFHNEDYEMLINMLEEYSRLLKIAEELKFSNIQIDAIKDARTKLKKELVNLVFEK